MTTAIEKAKQLVQGRYAPVNRKPTMDQWDGKTLSVSSLASKTAYDYAVELSQPIKDVVDPYYAYKGNALGDRALEDVPFKETRVTLPITPDVTLSGTMDGVIEEDGGVCVLEHKAYGEPNSKGILTARRQGEMYLSMLWEAARTYVGTADFPEPTFEPAPWAPDNGWFVWNPGSKPQGVVVCVAPENPPPMLLEFKMDEADCEKMIQKIRSKCKAIISAVQSGDFEVARIWDKTEGAMDFLTWHGEPVTELPSDVTSLVNEIAQAQLQERKLKAELKEKRDVLLGHLDAQGMTKAKVSGLTASVVEVDGTEISAHYRKGYRTVKVT